MRDVRGVVGALCIVLSMVLGAAAGFVYVRPDASPVESDVGTRSEAPEPTNLDGLAPVTEGTSVPATDMTSVPVTAGIAGANALPPGVSVSTERLSSEGTAATERYGTITGTRGGITAGVSSIWPPGTVDAGGPYGGAGFLEGSTDITFTVTANDPAILFFRWDFDDDGIFDYPEQTGAPMGTWTTFTQITRHYDDSYYGDVVVQGWDGLTQNPPVVITGTGGIAGRTIADWGIGFGGGVYHNIGYEFVAKKNAVVTRLGHWMTAGVQYYDQAIFGPGTWPNNKLGQCTPTHNTLQWNWCTLPTAVNIVLGQTYQVMLRFVSSTNGFNPPPDTDVVDHRRGIGAFCFDPAVDLCWGQTGFYSPIGFSYLVGPVDLEWREVKITPDTAGDTATLQVENVSPTVFGATTSPAPGLEGITPVEHVASFLDPGLEDTWQYRWTFSDGTTSGWRNVAKLSGGARVLYLHAQSDVIAAVSEGLRTACGVYCVQLDFFDFGPLGRNRVPTLDELRPYDVVYVAGRYGPIPSSSGMGNALADYMDVGGNVIIDHVANFVSDTWGIGGRWQSDGYAPVPRGNEIFANTRLDRVYVPGHPILDGVGSWTAQYVLDILNVRTGAVRVADWLNGRVAIATNENPKVSNGARSVYIDMVPFLGFDGGDFFRIMANSIRFASGQPDPTPKSMPIQLDPFEHVYPDDDPTSITPSDTFPVTVEVLDDDDGRMTVFSSQELFFTDFNTVSQCNWASSANFAWPPGWTAVPTSGWRCQVDQVTLGRGASIRYNYNFGQTSDLFTAAYDLSAFAGGRVEWLNVWAGGDPIFGGSADGYVDASVDNGATFPFRLAEFHMNSPKEWKSFRVDLSDIGGYPNVKFRFRWTSVGSSLANWYVDDFRVSGLDGEVVVGRGSVDGSVTIANVPPNLTGGFQSALTAEGQSTLFKGFEFSDPALLAPTESFMYAVDFGDGSPVVWRNLGSFGSPFKVKVLIVHTLCGSAGSGCAFFNTLRDNLLALDIVSAVDGYSFYPFSPPSLALFRQYDVIIVALNTILSGTSWDTTRRSIGDNLATFLEEPTPPGTRRGVLTFVGVYTGNFPAGTNNAALIGRYADYDYGPFEIAPFRQSAATLGAIVNDDHDALWNVRPGQVTTSVHDGDMAVSIGGQGLAAGRNGVLLADWDDGASAFGAKELANGRKTAHIGGFPGTLAGADARAMLRGAIGWAAGGMSIPRLKSFLHNYGDNGVYTVDFQLIDDDMGFVWDPVAGMPVAVLPGASVLHRTVSVAVDNVDPTITRGSITAFIAAQVCLRVTGTAGNTVTLNVMTDGVLSASTSVTRIGGDPNPPTDRCGLLKIDVTGPHAFSAQLTYAAPNGGSNPTWLVFQPWRDPVTPGHGTLTLKYNFAQPGTVTQSLPNLKQVLLDSGQGARIDFSAEASDVGTDDLAFFWSWGGEADIAYNPSPTSVYTIHVFHNNGAPRTDGTLAGSQYLGFSEPYFNKATNTGLSSTGATDFRVRDTATHAFPGGQMFYYVVLIVFDDDNARGYPSPFALDGLDVEVFIIDLS